MKLVLSLLFLSACLTLAAQPFGGIRSPNDTLTALVSGLTPDVYTYDFSVDGVKTFDSRNSQYKEGENGLSDIFELPGEEAGYCAVKDLPHGKVEKV